jgi:hypothetical protein
VTTRRTITPYTDTTAWICDRCHVERDYVLPRLELIDTHHYTCHLCGDCMKVIEEVLDWPAMIERVTS